MRDRYVVDTNVLIAASAADPTNPEDIDATPEEPEWRRIVWEWLNGFDSCTSKLVLDGDGKIYDEYCNKLGYQSYGRQVVIHKWSTICYEQVQVAYDGDGDAVLPTALAPVIHDHADRKMVAAALASLAAFGEGCVAFAGDTDWHDWEDALTQRGVLLEPIIEAWSRAKHAAKKHR